MSAETYQQYINGEFAASTTGEFIEVENPYTNQIIALAPEGGEEDAIRAVEAAKAAQLAWAKESPANRAVYLRKFAALIRENRIHLARTLAAEQAKVMPLAQVEIDFTADYFEYYAGWANIYEGEVINSNDPRENIWLNWKPIGVVAGICPWNFPFFVMARKVAPALLTGCTIVLKPSSNTPVTTFEFARLAATAGLPKGVLNFVSGSGSTLGRALVKHLDVDMVSLTGSVGAGQQILRDAADKVMKCSLELGGKAPAIVFPDADMDLTVQAVMDSRLGYSGQICNCAERAYVHSSVYDEFMTKLKAAFEAAAFDDPFADPAPAYSSQIDAAQLAKIDGMVQRAKAAGAEIVTGGAPVDRGTGYFYAPTIVAGAAPDSEIVKDEVFGPVLPVLPWDDYDEVIAQANDCEYGLTSSIYSTNVNSVMQGIKDLNFGETYVNRFHFEGLQGFHAGWRKSGIGGADGKHGLYEYLQSQVVYLKY